MEPRRVRQPTGERRLPRPRQAAHQDQAGPGVGGRELPQGEEPVGPRLLPRRPPLLPGHGFVGGGHPLHLAPDGRPVRRIEREEAASLVVPGGPDPGVGEGVGKVAPPLEGEVHHEKAHVGDRVAVPEPLVELDAVQHHQVVGGLAVREEVDVVQVEIAVGVPRNVALGPVRHQRPDLLQAPAGEAAEAVVDRPAHRLPHVVHGLVEVLHGVARHDVPASEGGDLGPRGRLPMEPGDAPCHARQVPFLQLAPVQPLTERRVLREAAHLHDVLHDGPGPAGRGGAGIGLLSGGKRRSEPEVAVHPDQRRDAQIDVRGQPPVQEDLLAAIAPASLQGREVQEAQVHRLLHLVGEVAGEEDHRDVGVVHLDGHRRMGVGGGAAEGLDHTVEGHGDVRLAGRRGVGVGAQRSLPGSGSGGAGRTSRPAGGPPPVRSTGRTSRASQRGRPLCRPRRAGTAAIRRTGKGERPPSPLGEQGTYRCRRPDRAGRASRRPGVRTLLRRPRPRLRRRSRPRR